MTTDNRKLKFTVVVANVGNIPIADKEQAVKCFNHYVKESQNQEAGRCYGEDVTLFYYDEIVEEYIGTRMVTDVMNREAVEAELALDKA